GRREWSTRSEVVRIFEIFKNTAGKKTSRNCHHRGLQSVWSANFVEPNSGAETPNDVRGNVPHAGTSHFLGDFNMKRLGSPLSALALKAGAVAIALVLSTSGGHAQSRPFAGFDGAWSGNGTVSLSDG